MQIEKFEIYTTHENSKHFHEISDHLKNIGLEIVGNGIKTETKPCGQSYIQINISGTKKISTEEFKGNLETKNIVTEENIESMNFIIYRLYMYADKIYFANKEIKICGFIKGFENIHEISVHHSMTYLTCKIKGQKVTRKIYFDEADTNIKKYFHDFTMRVPLKVQRNGNNEKCYYLIEEEFALIYIAQLINHFNTITPQLSLSLNQPIQGHL